MDTGNTVSIYYKLYYPLKLNNMNKEQRDRQNKANNIQNHLEKLQVGETSKPIDVSDNKLYQTIKVRMLRTPSGVYKTQKRGNVLIVQRLE